MKLKRKFFLNFSSLPTKTKKARRKNKYFKNYELNKLIKLSMSKGFIGVEFPYFRFFAHSKSVKYLIRSLKENNQRYIMDCEKRVSKKELLKLIYISRDMGIKFIRVKCSNILSCERKNYRNEWKKKVDSIISKIEELKPLLNKYKIKLAIENHQDLDSNDILYIIKNIGKKYVGVNFDVGNSFATCETPLYFFKKIKVHIINIHLKDYIILPSKRGFVLHRCPIMDGNAQLSEILFLIKKYQIKSPISVELGSKTPREIKIKSKIFFKSFLKDKKIKIKNSKSIMKLAEKNFTQINDIKKLISLNEINMLNKSIKNLNY